VAPAPPTGKCRRSNSTVQFVPSDDPDGTFHSSCPSCLDYFKYFTKLKEHVNTSHVIEEVKDSSSVVKGDGKILFFTPANRTRNSPSASVPLLPKNVTNELQKCIKLITPYNTALTKDDIEILKQEQKDQKDLECLRKLEHVHNLLLKTVEINEYKNWHSHIWKSQLKRLLINKMDIVIFNAY
jgi:uncharacterized C2H2 Zn-finger protein